MALFSSKHLLLLFMVSNALYIQFGYSLTLIDWTIQLFNGSNNTVLVTRCLINGSGIGSKSIEPLARQDFQCPVWVKKRSLATCDVNLGNLKGRFDAFDSDRDLKRCRNNGCLWVVNGDGAFLNIGSQYVLQYRWP